MFFRLVVALSAVFSTLATYAGPDRHQRLVEAAKKEGSLLFYTTTPTEYVAELVQGR